MPDALELLTEGLFSGGSLSQTTIGLLVDQPVHQRERIRDWVVARLRGEAMDSDRIHVCRILPVDEETLPALFIYTRDEDSERWNRSPSRLLRQLELVVDIVLSKVTNLESQADTIANIIEHIVMVDPGQGENAADTILSRTEKGFSGEGEAQRILCRLVFTVTYQTEVVELVPDDLQQLRAQVDLAVPDGTAESEDIVSVPVKEGP